MKVQLHLRVGSLAPVTVEAESAAEFAALIERWAKTSLVVALVEAADQLAKKTQQIEALLALVELANERKNNNVNPTN
jgi:hypothetical protein